MKVDWEFSDSCMLLRKAFLDAISRRNVLQALAMLLLLLKEANGRTRIKDFLSAEVYSGTGISDWASIKPRSSCEGHNKRKAGQDLHNAGSRIGKSEEGVVFSWNLRNCGLFLVHFHMEPDCTDETKKVLSSANITTEISHTCVGTLMLLSFF